MGLVMVSMGIKWFLGVLFKLLVISGWICDWKHGLSPGVIFKISLVYMAVQGRVSAHDRSLRAQSW